LKKLLDETTTLHQALNLVEQTKALIQDVEVLLPDSPNLNFRERLTAHLESLEDHSGSDRMASMNFRDKAEALLALYENVFGVTDVLETPPES
jgi:hypothetical protein